MTARAALAQPPGGASQRRRAAAPATVAFGTKAQTLERLQPLMRAAAVPPQVRFTVAQWQTQDPEIWRRLWAAGWSRRPLIVRSSAIGEDGAENSLAGRFRSIAGVDQAGLPAAVEQVIASYQPADMRHEVFIQPLVQDVVLSGVAFTQDPNSGGPYLIVNYDETAACTDGVTGGRGRELKTFICTREGQRGSGALAPVIAMLRELERLLGQDALDVEFALDAAGIVHLLQVRPLAAAGLRAEPRRHGRLLRQIAAKVAQLNAPHPYLHGRRTVLGIMPDWNPAEIVGVRPRPLALSLYRELITDSIWAYQRDAYGYKNLRSFPLLVSLHGLPYVDVRVSFNSFVPKTVGGALADRLVNHYIDRLIAQPYLHDKVEFEIILSCYSFDMAARLAALGEAGFSAADCDELAEALRGLTNRVVNQDTGLWRKDLERVAELERRVALIQHSQLDDVARLYWLLEDCKRYGTLPFAGLARAGFIAVQLLRSLVTAGVLSQADHECFMAGLNTVSSRLGADFASLGREAFLNRYGHLRPGTYDITCPRYDEAADRYFDWTAARPAPKPAPAFSLSLAQLQQVRALLKANRIDHDAVSLFEFIKAGIEGREYAKFLFTRSLSDALSLFGKLAAAHGFGTEDCSYAEIACIRDLHASCLEPGEVLARSIAEGKRRHADTQSLVLPPLIVEPRDVHAFTLPPLQPNFITRKSAVAPVAAGELTQSLGGRIACIESADPGYDWIFSRGIAGLVTAYGGVNSHMAIRAGELGVPAVIGAGEQLYRRWSQAARLSLDCANRQVEVLG